MNSSDIVNKGNKMKGRVKQVYSGDRIVLYGPLNKQGIPFEKILQLVSVRAPRTGVPNERKNENNSFMVKNYLRQLVIGKQVEFYLVEKKDGYEIASVYLDGNELSHKMLSNGMGQFQFKKDAQNQDIYKHQEESAKNNKKGVWGDKQEEG